MTETTPDYAGLIARLDAVKHGSDRPYAASVAADAIEAISTLLSNYKTAQANWELALERNAALERERDEARESVKQHREWLSDAQHRAGERLGRIAELEARVIDLELEVERFTEGVVLGQHRVKVLEARLAEADRVIEPFAAYLDDGFDLDDKGMPRPDDNPLGWVYLTFAHLRAARAYRDKGRE